MTNVKIDQLIGKTITEIEVKVGDESIVLVTDKGTYKFYHDQD